MQNSELGKDDSIYSTNESVSYSAYKKDKDLQSWFNDFAQNRLAANLNAFKRYEENVYDLVKTYVPSRSYELFCNADGVANLYLNEINRCLYDKGCDAIEFSRLQVENYLSHGFFKQTSLKNETDPYGQFHYKYANSLFSDLEKNKREPVPLSSLNSLPMVVFLGVGLGYVIGEFLSKIESKNIIIIEPDFDLFFASLGVFDWANLLNYAHENNVRIRFVIGDRTENIALYLRHFLAHHGQFLISGIHFFKHYSSPAILKTEKLIGDVYPYLYSTGFFDDSVFGTCHGVSHLIKGKHFVVDSLKNSQYSAVPVFIVGSGPSLDKSIPFLRKYQDKAIIIACGTAIDSLYHAGVQPDFFANTERVPEIAQSLDAIPEKSFFDDVILLCTEVCHPNVMQRFKNTAIFSKDNEPFFSYAESIVDELSKVKKISYINPLVGNMGVSGALHLGFRSLYLFGLDNGKKIGTESIHSAYTTLYKKRGYSEAVAVYDTPVTVPANFGGQCNTNTLYRESAFRCSLVLEDFQKHDPSVRCKNCSDGIAIQNTIPTRENEIADEFENRETIDKEAFREYVKNTLTRSFSLTQDDIKKFFNKDVLDRFYSALSSELEGKFTTAVDYIEHLETIHEKLVSQELSSEYEFYSRCFLGSLQELFIHAVIRLYGEADEVAGIEKADMVMATIKDFVTEAKAVLEKMPDYIMGEHTKYYADGKLGRNMPTCEAPRLPEKIVLAKKTYDDPQQRFQKLYQ